ncbi:MAG: phosphatidylglycerophosphatase A [Sedimentisphaerales bacterium]|nr:phosphatidylglycerophosphatase A [Sedimentisphaerales bacterium]
MARFFLTVFGTGWSPLVPGTCASAVTAAVFAVLVLLGVSPRWAAAIMLVLALHGAVITAVYGDAFIEQLGNKDPRPLVSDEQAGQALVFAGVFWLLASPPAGGNRELLIFALTAFLLFRFFDILKPFPVHQLEAVRGAWGVLLDDLGAGVYALIVQTIIWKAGWLKSLWA